MSSLFDRKIMGIYDAKWLNAGNTEIKPLISIWMAIAVRRRPITFVSTCNADELIRLAKRGATGQKHNSTRSNSSWLHWTDSSRGCRPIRGFDNSKNKEINTRKGKVTIQPDRQTLLTTLNRLHPPDPPYKPPPFCVYHVWTMNTIHNSMAE